MTVLAAGSLWRTLQQTWLPWKVDRVGDNSLKVFCDENDTFRCTTPSCTCVWGQSSWLGHRQRGFSSGMCCAGSGPLLAARDTTAEMGTCPVNTLPVKGTLGKGSEIWGRAEMLLKPVCRGSKEFWAEEDLQSQLLRSANTEKWSQSRRGGSVMWGLRLEVYGGSWGGGKGNFPVLPCSFNSTGINLRQRTIELFWLGRKQSILSKEKKKWIEFTFVIRRKVVS